jgi:HSP20 family protein
MSTTRWDPFTVLARLDTEFDELVRRTWGSQTGRPTAGFVPACEVSMAGSDVVITLELPGVDVERDVDIEVAQGRLTIKGERQELRSSDEGKRDKTLVRELRYGSFRREFALPDQVSADDVDAAYDRGMLFVRIRNVAKPVEAPRKVSIRPASQQQSVSAEAEQAQISEGTKE